MGAKKHILIAEDERPLAHALQLKLEHEGHIVIVASNGQEALDAIATTSFDVILLDVMMPEVDGFHVLKSLTNHPNPPYVVVLSNLSQHEDEEKAFGLGAKKYFIKSNTPLSEIVAEVGKV